MYRRLYRGFESLPLRSFEPGFMVAHAKPVMHCAPEDFLRRGARVVESAGLENRNTLRGIEGSNPSLSASGPGEHRIRRVSVGASCFTRTVPINVFYQTPQAKNEIKVGVDLVRRLHLDFVLQRTASGVS